MSMNDKMILTGVLMDEETTVSLVDISQKYKISKELLSEMVEQGLLDESHVLEKEHFNYKTFCRIQSACRLQQDLGVNLPGVALIFELVEALDSAHNKLDILQRYLDNRENLKKRG